MHVGVNGVNLLQRRSVTRHEGARDKMCPFGIIESDLFSLELETFLRKYKVETSKK